MPRFIPFRPAAACMLALCSCLVLSLAVTAAAAAKGAPVEVRVVGAGDKVLAETFVKATTTTIPTSPKANCFGKGTGGTGRRVALHGPTALGALSQVVERVSSLRPLLVTNHFSFGLAICGVGGSVVKRGSESSWYLKVNHKAASVGGDQVKLHQYDEVLWDLAPSYPYPDELVLASPYTAAAERPFSVHVWAYDEKGKRKPAAGVEVTGASEPTGSDGTTTVTLTEPTTLFATRSGDIPSAGVDVCFGVLCPRR